ncbi:MAG: LPS export ABC transporter permease LptG [Rhodobacteraceae bacterium]|nr:LPS export ABC transporter permease LptG [Paracoccaceae bacterium]
MKLHLYFARRFLVLFAGILTIFLILQFLFDLIEHLRLFGSSSASFRQILSLTLLNVPLGLYKLLPLIMILSTLALFLSLARTSELVVTRGAGRSALRSLMSPGLMGMLIGVLAVALFNPIAAGTSRQYGIAKSELTGSGNFLELSGDSLWLRQGTSKGQTVIHASSANHDGTVLNDVTFITFTFADGPVRRVKAETASLVLGAWETTKAKVWPLTATDNPEVDALEFETFSVPSTMTPSQIRDSFASPSSISIWNLPAFIEQLATAGFSSRRHEVYFQTELAQPIFLLAMLLIGAGFTMRHQRGGRTGMMVLSAILLCFGLYFLRNFAAILGENGQIPVALAAWAPPLAGIGLSLGFLLHTEDG